VSRWTNRANDTPRATASDADPLDSRRPSDHLSYAAMTSTELEKVRAAVESERSRYQDDVTIEMHRMLASEGTHMVGGRYYADRAEAEQRRRLIAERRVDEHWKRDLRRHPERYLDPMRVMQLVGRMPMVFAINRPSRRQRITYIESTLQ
jgi:hypothetical protein